MEEDWAVDLAVSKLEGGGRGGGGGEEVGGSRVEVREGSKIRWGEGGLDGEGLED